MQGKLTHLSLAFAILALAVSAYSLTREGGPTRDAAGPSGSSEELAAIGRRVDRLAQAVEALGGAPSELRESGESVPDLADRDSGSAVEAPEEADARLKALVDVAVEEKAQEVTEKLRMKADKKPSIEALAKLLELSNVQRESVEQEVIRGQGEVYDILELPTAGGRNLMDDLVELAARSIAEPGKDPGWAAWYGQVLSEKIPGTDETYATRIEAAKATMRDTFRRIMSEKQYAEFEDWSPDPVEIQGIPGSPREALVLKVRERAGEMGAKLPEDEEK